MNDKLSFEQIEILRFLRSQEGCTVSRERFFEAFPKIERKTYTALGKLGYLKVDSEADPISLTDSGKGLIDEYLADKEEKQYQRGHDADTLKTAQEANEYAKEANTIARDANVTAEEANSIAREANKRADRANAIAIVALVISVIAILASVFVR
nr:MAG TPA: Transcription factor MotA, activation domain [Caudoviricetes sp.]